MNVSNNPSDRAAEIFDHALRLAQDVRERYVREACGADATLRRLIDDMLAAHAKQGEFLAEPTGDRRAAAPSDIGTADIADTDFGIPPSAPMATQGTLVGRYKLLQQIGTGGFGEVWMAEQREPIKRRVALKIIKPGMDSKQVIARFEAERQALAMMDHPNIARVFDAGMTEAGRPYFVMELVRGVPITEYCDTENLNPQDRLELFTKVCQAVQHAHQKGIIHRDIKPSNVLVTLHDGTPVPKVIDFGIAKATSGDLTDKTLFTEFRQLIGTPQYMSPEQAEMSGVDIDTRSDIYSLGVLLYELLTGVTPFDAARLRSAALEEMRRIIREEDPPRPSTRVSTLGNTLSNVARHRKVEPTRLGALIRGDLDWITMKCLEKDRARRYGTANDLAADVIRHLTGDAVVAAPPSTAYRVRKFIRRHRGPVVAASLVTGALVLGMIGITVGLFYARAAERRATAEAERASRIGRFMQSTLFGLSDEENLAASRDVLKELIAGAAASAGTMDPQRWANVRLALRLIEGHWRETPPSTEEFSHLLTDLVESALAGSGSRAAASREASLSEHNARGVLLVLTGRLSEAERVFRAALALADAEADPRERLVRADQLTRLGLIAETIGTGEERRLFPEALEIRRHVLGAQHPGTAESMEDLARAVSPGESGSFTTRLELLEECLAVRRASSCSPESIARVLTGIGYVKSWSERMRPKAILYLREALDSWREALPGDHDRTADALIELGHNLSLTGDAREGEQLIQDGIAMIERLETGPSKRLAVALYRLAAAQDRSMQFTLAVESAERSIVMFEDLSPPEPGYWEVAIEQMRDSCRRMAAVGDTDAAYSWYTRLIALSAVGKTWGEWVRDLMVRTEFRTFLEWCGRVDEAEKVLRGDRAYEPYMRYPYAQRLTDELENIGETCLAIGKYAEAEDWFRRCLAQREQLQLIANDGSSGAFLVPLTRGKVGWALMKQGKFADAEPLLLKACESTFPGQPTEDRRIAIDRLVLLYEAWQASEPNEARGAKAAKWRERLATLELASSLGEYLGIENVRALLITVSAGDSLSYPQWKRARTFVRFMTGDWTEDPLTAVPFREVVAAAIKTIDMQPSAPDSNIVVEPDKASIDYIVSHAALCVLDGRWEDADAALWRALDERPDADDVDDTIRLLGCQAALKEALGQPGLAHSLYRRIADTLEARPSGDPVWTAGAIIDAARTTAIDSDAESLMLADDLRRALDLLLLELPASDMRPIRCQLELAETLGWWSDSREQAEVTFSAALVQLQAQHFEKPLAQADALERFGAFLAAHWNSYPPSQAADLLERATDIYRAAGLATSPQMANTLKWLSIARGNGNALDLAAAEALQESLEIRLSLGESDLSSGDDGRIYDLFRGADYFAAAEDLVNAERFYRAAVSIAERDPAGTYPAKEARTRLGQFLKWTGRETEAAALLHPGDVAWSTNSRTHVGRESYVERLGQCCRNIAAHLLRSREPADAHRAVQIIQRGVSILETGVPQAERAAWWKHDFDGLLGDALAVQGKFEEAEATLVASYEALKSAPELPPTTGGQDRLREILARIVRMYDAWHLAEPGKGFESKAAEWRTRLESTAPTSAPSSRP